MKATELMQGDIILYELDGFKYPARVVEIYRDSICVEEINGEYEPIDVGQDKVFPIPITPVILEKNGFRRYGNTGWWLEDDYYDINVYEWSDSIWVFEYERNEMRSPHTQVDFNYVHELQHALRMCAADKEIEL